MLNKKVEVLPHSLAWVTSLYIMLNENTEYIKYCIFALVSGLSIAVERERRIVAIDPDHEVDSGMKGCSFELCIDASGMSVVPDLMDAHAHPRLGRGQGARVYNKGKELIN